MFDLDFWPNTNYGIKLLIGYTETFNFGVSSLAKQNFSNSIDLKFKLRFLTLLDWFKTTIHLRLVSSPCKHNIRPVYSSKKTILVYFSFGRKHPELNISPMILNIVFQLQLAKDSTVITLH